MSLVEVAHLSVAFGARRVVHDVSFTLDRGETLALVGESGSGKSVTALSLLQLLPPGGSNPEGSVRLNGEEMIGAGPQVLQQARGGLAGMIFQEPMTSLNPVISVGNQIAESYRAHTGAGRREARTRTLELMRQVGIPSPEHRRSEERRVGKECRL